MRNVRENAGRWRALGPWVALCIFAPACSALLEESDLRGERAGAGGAGGVAGAGGAAGAGRGGAVDAGGAAGKGGAGGVSAYKAMVLADRPELYFRLDEPTGATAARSLVNDVEAKNFGAIFGVKGVAATQPSIGARFVGDSAVSSLEPAFSLGTGNSFTIEAWARTNLPPAGLPYCIASVETASDGISAFLLWDGSAVIAMVFGADGAVQQVEVPQNLSDGLPYLLAVVHDGLSLAVCVGRADGTFECAQDDRLVSAFQQLVSVFLGGSLGGPCDGMRGELDEVAFYSYPLSFERLRAHQMAGLGLAPEPSGP